MTLGEFKDQVDSLADSAYLKVTSMLAILACVTIGPFLAYWVIDQLRQSSSQLTVNSQTIAVLQANAANDREQIRAIRSELAARTVDRYTMKDAERDFRFVGERIDSLGRRVGSNETRVDRLEQARTR